LLEESFRPCGLPYTIRRLSAHQDSHAALEPVVHVS
jgi:hypothetical protein